jgi:serine-type D-Ala-D-Ala carboxypeptidase/endopeptidase (penicillin-binding protein 4)
MLRMSSRRAVFLLFLTLTLSSAAHAFAAKAAAARSAKPPTATARLTKAVNAILAGDPNAARAFWGMHIYSLDRAMPLYSMNADRLFTPASNTKLFTTIAALTLLGPDHRTRTTVESSGSIVDGHLTGDLILVGRGDPNLSGRVLPYSLKTQRTTPHLKLLEDFADAIVRKGVKVIDGDVIGDDSYFAWEPLGEGWSQDDLLWEYGAPVSALTVNDNVFFLTILPGEKQGDTARVRLDPDVSYYDIDDRVVTDGLGGAAHISINRHPGSKTLTLWGSIPLDWVNGYNEALAIEDPAEYAAQAFRAMLEARGVRIAGKQRAQHLSPASVPEKANAVALGGGIPAAPVVPVRNVLAERDSAPLMDDVRVINKVSQNLHAELALRLLGQAKGANNTTDSALDAEKQVLTQAGLVPEEYFFADGSGLSRQDLVSPAAIVKILRFAAAQPWAAQFQDSLPVAGLDGSLADRFDKSPAKLRVLAKTGTLGHVNALSGYARTLRGENIAFSLMVNNHKLTSKGAQELMDRVVEAMVNDLPPAQGRKKRATRRP